MTSSTTTTTTTPSNEQQRNQNLRDILEDQKRYFVKQYNISHLFHHDHNDTTSTTMEEYNFMTRCLRYIIDKCARIQRQYDPNTNNSNYNNNATPTNANISNNDISSKKQQQ